MLAHDRARVEVAQLEVGVLRAELVAQLVARGVGERPRLADHLAGLPGQLGQPVGAEDEHRHEGDDGQLRQPDAEHGSEPAGRGEPELHAGESAAAAGRASRRPRRARAAAGAVGSASTIGLPTSPPSRSELSSGIRPRTRDVVAEALGERRRDPVAAAAAEDLERCSVPSAAQCGQGRKLMFSTTPTTRWCIIEAIVPARSATSAAASCGVVTTTTSALGQVLAQRDRDVAGARRQVEQQHVEVAPVDVGEHLHQRPVEHRAAPGDDLVAARLEHADRDHRDAATAVGHRHDQVVDLGGAGVGDAEHRGDRVAVDVGVDDADLEALLGHRERRG